MPVPSDLPRDRVLSYSAGRLPVMQANKVFKALESKKAGLRAQIRLKTVEVDLCRSKEHKSTSDYEFIVKTSESIEVLKSELDVCQRRLKSVSEPYRIGVVNGARFLR